MSKVLFSGRFDPFHVGHLRTVQLLARKYDVLVVVLDYHKQRFPICYRLTAMRETIGTLIGNVQIECNKTHFGKLHKDEWELWGCDLYAAGNFEVLNHMESIGVRCIYVDRPYQISARYYDKPQKT